MPGPWEAYAKPLSFSTEEDVARAAALPAGVPDEGTPESRATEIEREIPRAPTPWAKYMLRQQLGKERGGATPLASVEAPPEKQNIFSRLLGREPGEKPDFLADVKKGFGISDPKGMLRDIVSVADLATTGVTQMVLNVFGTSVGQTVAAAAGADRSEALAFGKEFGQAAADHPALNQPLTKLFNWVAKEEKPSTVDDVMTRVTELIRQGGEATEKATKGAVRKEDVELLANALMAGLGAKGQRAVFERPGKAPGPPAAPEAGPLPLDASAIEKARAGEGFKMSPAEKEAMSQAGRDLGEKPPAETPGEDPMVGLWQAAGKMAVIGGAAAGLEYLYPGKDDDHPGLTLAATGVFLTGRHAELAAKPEASTLGVMIEKSANTLKTLEIPEFQNRSVFTRQMLEEALRRTGVTKAEKDVFAAALAGAGDTISAKRLVLGLKEATGDFELKPKETESYADYGLENIDRLEADLDALSDAQAEGVDVAELRRTGGQPARTTIYQSPLNLGTGNHFSDPNYFAHTRSFDEDGVRHVVEIQSDLAQKKLLTEEQTYQLQTEQLANSAEIGRLEAGTVRGELHGKETHSAVQRIRLRQEEIRTALQRSVDAEKAVPLTPMLKDWYKRIIREELAGVARETDRMRGELGEALADAEKRPGEFRPSDVEGWKRQLAEGEKGVVRFATADTVAKVEGWPEAEQARETYRARIERYKQTIASAQQRIDEKVRGEWPKTFEYKGIPQTQDIHIPDYQHAIDLAKQELVRDQESLAKLGTSRFSPEHQGIYDRYRGDIEKFLKSLGGKEVKDDFGHSWIEVPTKVPESGPRGARAAMFGRADPSALIGLAAMVGGAWIGSQVLKDQPILGGLLGVVGAATITTGLARRIGRKMIEAGKPDARIRIDELGNAHEYDIARTRVTMWQFAETLRKMVPKVARREAVATAVEKGSPAGLSPQEAAAYHRVEAFMNGMWAAAAKVGVNLRKIPDLPADIADRAEAYGNFIGRATADRKVLQSLKETKAEGGVGLVTGVKDAPRGYIRLNVPALDNFRVHPDIAPSLKFLFEAKEPHVAIRAAEAVNTAIKRLAVSFSLFHAKALLDAAIGGFRSPLTPLKIAAQAAAPRLFGLPKYLQELRDVGVSPTIDMALKGGLKFSLERGAPGVEDVGAGFYEGMRSLQRLLDEAAPGAKIGTATVGNLARLNHAFDNFMWGRLHAGLKLSLFAEKYETLLKNSPELGREEAARQAASFANDLFGGLNWRRIAEGARTQWGRDLKLTTLQPAGRRGLQILLFAPDWTYSTTRAFTQAFVGKGGSLTGTITGAKGLADLHRQYLLRSAIYYAAVGDAINLQLSGHHIWENRDKDGNIDFTYIDLGDGRRMQWSKHTMEPIHWMQHPQKTLINKLGYVPKEGLSQAFGVEYVAPYTSKAGQQVAGPPMKEGPVAHALKGMSPISVQQGQEGGPLQGASGMFGIPIYGKTQEQRNTEKEEWRRKRLGL